MKKFFGAIGGFFVKIWNWIKNTAWIQPLLIVGLIFGVIFSIRPIYDGIKSAIDSRDEAVEFYKEYKKSLNKGANSDADKLINEMQNVYTGAQESTSYGDKFFLTFVDESCTSCTETYNGFKTLKKGFASDYRPEDGKSFKLYTIFTDEETDETTTIRSAFTQFLDRQSQFFLYAAEEGWGSNYYLNGKLSASDLNALQDADYDDFKTPTIILFDKDAGGISEIMFGTGSSGTDNDKAQLLLDCWNHKGDFAEK